MAPPRPAASLSWGVAGLADGAVFLSLLCILGVLSKLALLELGHSRAWLLASGLPTAEDVGVLVVDFALLHEKPRIKVLKLTIVNEWHKEVLDAAMGGLLRTPSFTEDMRLACTDDTSLRWCKETISQPRHCMRTRRAFGTSDFMKNDYLALIYLKWKVSLQALQWPGVESVFFLDADVAVFAPIEDHFDGTGVDFMFAWHLPHENLNGGQLWFNRTDVSMQYIRKVLTYQLKPWPLDQDFATRLLGPPLRYKSLPNTSFQSYCWTIAGLGDVTSSTITYHATCVGTKPKKLKVLHEAHKKHQKAVAGRQ